MHRASDTIAADVVVVGTGIAGMSAALGLPGGCRVHLLTKTDWDIGGSSRWAQGGLAAAVGPGDTPERHAADTLAVGGGLNDPAVVAILTRGGPPAVARLVALGARFDRDPDGRLVLGREAAHHRRRILHAHGDATGAEIVRALMAAVHAAPHVTVFTRAFAWDLVVRAGRVAGVRAVHADGRAVLHTASAVVLATGGCGQLYRFTTNPPEVTGDGLAMAARAGAGLADLEFVQFHPTALAVDDDPLPLLTEALRGEGARLVDPAGRRFMTGVDPEGELAPRDVVARAIWRELAEGRQAFLDVRGTAIAATIADRFPTVFAACMRHGIDPRRAPMPVVPAAHYHMGGVEVDAWGRASLVGLWACGEVAATGAHGANRLASNSLLEALVFGGRVARDVAGRLAAGGSGAVPDAGAPPRPAAVAGSRGTSAGGGPRPHPGRGEPDLAALRAEVRRRTWDEIGLVRDAAGLTAALAALAAVSDAVGDAWPEADATPEADARPEPRASGGFGPADIAAAAADAVGDPHGSPAPDPAADTFERLCTVGEIRNLAFVGRLVATAAQARRESRGAHFRSDYPAPAPGAPRRVRVRWVAPEIVATAEPTAVDQPGRPPWPGPPPPGGEETP